MRFVFLLTCSLAVLMAQEAETIFRSDAKLVELHVTVTDKEGRIINGLPQSAFRVLENDVEQEIKVFRQEDAPVSLGLVIDNSASMTDKRAKVAAAALTLVRESNPGDEVFIINFNEKPALVTDFTNNVKQLESGLTRINPNGQTALRDALSVGLEHLKRSGKSDKKVLLVVSDGEDNSSATDLARLTRDTQKAGVLIYAIGLLSDASQRETERAKKDLDTLTQVTGGESFYPTDLGEVDEIAKHVAHDLRNQYTVAYSPSDTRQDGSFRRLQVTVARPDAVVRTRTGYFSSGATVSSQ